MSNHPIKKSLRTLASRRPTALNGEGARARSLLTSFIRILAEDIPKSPRTHPDRPEAVYVSARVGQSEQSCGLAELSGQRADSKPTHAADHAHARSRRHPAKEWLAHRSGHDVMTVAQLSQRAGVSSHVVRYYSRRGLLTPVRHPDNQYRLYCSAHVSRLRFIQQAKTLGFSLREIQSLLQDAEQGKSPCPRVRSLIASRIEANRRKLDALMALQRRMEDALRRWETLPDRVPSADTVCHLIESYDGAMTALATTAHGA
jgi:MerR family Zn(II)-responsive transcriptional regulator of zntA